MAIQISSKIQRCLVKAKIEKSVTNIGKIAVMYLQR